MPRPQRHNTAMNTVTPDRRIFDEHLLRRRMAHALSQPGYPDFLFQLASDEIADRLASVKRDFERTVVLCDQPAFIAPVLTRSGQHRHLIHAAPAPGAAVCADYDALPFRAESIDCIVSLLNLHAINDLPGALIQYRRALRPDGLFIACLLGADSLRELRQAWLAAEADTTGGASPRVAPFTDTRELGGLLQRAGFALPVVDRDCLTLTYPSALAAMREIKQMGWSNALSARSRTPVTHRLLARAAAAYEAACAADDGRVPLTLNLAYLAGWAPHESQQKPLKPGSARVRLADALSVREHTLKARRD